MDLQMPVMDGYTAAKRFRQWEIEKGRTAVPIIAFSSSVMTEDIKKCLAAGFSSHVSKPIRKEELLGKINEYA